MFLISLISASLLASTAVATASPVLEKRYPTGVPAISYPAGGFAGNCPEASNNLFYQGVQKRDVDLGSDLSFFEETKPYNYSFPPETEIDELRKRSLEPRQYKTCTNIARFDFQGFTRPVANTQDLYLSKGSTYTFSMAASVNIKLAYAWIAPYGTDMYTLVGTGAYGGPTATVIITLSQDSHVHFQAFAESTISNGAVAIFKQDV